MMLSQSRTAVKEKLMEEFTELQKAEIEAFRRTSTEQFEKRRRVLVAEQLAETKNLTAEEFNIYLGRIRAARPQRNS